MVNRLHFPMVAAAGTVWIRFAICLKKLIVSNSALAIAKLGIKNALEHGLPRYPELEEFDRRILKERRKQPTPALSRYALWGERRTLRRKRDQQAGGYVDSYSPTVFFFVISIVGLNVIDAFQTIMLLDLGGWEVNPIVQSAMRLYGDNFWIWKFFIASAAVVFLCVHSKFREGKTHHGVSYRSVSRYCVLPLPSDTFWMIVGCHSVRNRLPFYTHC